MTTAAPEIEQRDDDVLTVAEAARLLKLNPKTVYKLVDEGLLPHCRITERRIRFLRSSLIAWLASRESAPRRKSP